MDSQHDDTPRHFITEIIDGEIASGRWGDPGDASVVRTRFPPEPNGFLHVGHAKAICVSFGLAERYGGACNLRFDDTNPEKEEDAYVRAIIEDVRWLGFAWPGMADPSAGGDPAAGVLFASDYFGRMYELARGLVEKGLAYVDEQSPEEIRAQRGTLKGPGTGSPFRDRPASESLALLEKMKSGGVEDGSMVLRAKIDMASPNMNLRDPVMYRVVRAAHHRTGSEWSIYPMYDWAHGLEDSIEGITHSLCTLEFEHHRPLYDWFIEAINRDNPEPIHHSRQIEFARLNPSYIITSKRKLKQLVDGGVVDGWDDPRMPTLSGLRRRGFTPEAIRGFCDGVGVTKFNAVHDIGLLENAARNDLNRRAPRRMCVLDPVRVVIENWGEHGEADRVEMMTGINNPEDEAAGTREIPFGGVLYVERDDYMDDAPKKWFRLTEGREVRLRYGYWITCREAVKENGELVELRCTYDPLTRGGDSPPADAEGRVRKVKGTLHWVAKAGAVGCRVRLIDRLFTAERPGKRTDEFMDDLNPEAMRLLEGCRLEPNWRTTGGERDAGTGVWSDGIERFQFERQGYFCVDACGAVDGVPVFNRTVPLRDSWSKSKGK